MRHYYFIAFLSIFFSLQCFAQFEPVRYLRLSRHWTIEEVVYRQDSTFHLRTSSLRCSDSIEGIWQLRGDTILMNYGNYQKKQDCSQIYQPWLIEKYIVKNNRLYMVFQKRNKWKVNKKVFLIKDWK